MRIICKLYYLFTTLYHLDFCTLTDFFLSFFIDYFCIIVIYSFCFVDTVVSTINTTFDTTKNVAASAVDKGTTLIGTAKGIIKNLFKIEQGDFCNLFKNIFSFLDSVASTVDTTKKVAASAVDTGMSYVGTAKGSKVIKYFNNTCNYITLTGNKILF